jgi:hypothetical protein
MRWYATADRPSQNENRPPDALPSGRFGELDRKTHRKKHKHGGTTMNDEETRKIEMIGAAVTSLFYKNNAFLSTSAIKKELQEISWAQPDFIVPALERLVTMRQLAHDPKHGYCLAQSYKNLKAAAEYTGPKLTRQEFDRLSFQEKNDFFKTGGLLT